ncbi:unnamed protein product [Clonostachys solani]|uniref:Uncharacterized protein n=1 Tax=Clonostachys solani TaxID=160281 RepID=A0A9N9WAY9_9HYPO|nr:unnamed protein product [Clonostachys solani]
MLSINQPRKLSTHKAVILGDGGVGKTSITTQFVRQYFVETYDPTDDDNYRKQIEVDGEPCLVEVLEVASSAEYEALRSLWTREGEVFMIVFSLSSRSSFTRAKNYYQQIQDVKKTTVPLILVGNKCDRAPELHEVSPQEGESLAREFGCTFMMTSAKCNKNIDEAFAHLIRLNVKQREEQRAKETAAAITSEPQGNEVEKKGWKKRLSSLLTSLGKGNRG